MLRATLLVALLVALWAIAVSVGLERTQSLARFDAETHRESIRAVESVLYRSTPPQLGDGDRVADALLRLAEALAPHGSDFRARRRALRLYDLIGLASGTGDAGYALPDLGFLRGAWEQQRDALFTPAPWFGRSDASLVAARTPHPAAVDPAQVTRLRHTARRLERLAEAGEAELRELPPPPPFDAEPALVLAHQNTSQAANQLWLVPQGVGDWPTPFCNQWESRFSAARQLLAKRRAALVIAPD